VVENGSMPGIIFFFEKKSRNVNDEDGYDTMIHSRKKAEIP
jgi:hypothetical protein